MPAIQYPFIDIAVHPRVRERFAHGEAMALFSTGMDRVLWANGAGADLFGYAAIYDFLDQGPKGGNISFRQIATTARQITGVGERRNVLIRMTSGFSRIVVNAAVEMIRTSAGEDAILFSAPLSAAPPAIAEGARRMLDGFDDPDTHVAVIGRDGEVIASSDNFGALGITTQTAKMLVTMAGAQADRLIKRPIATGQGYLPAAIGKLSEIPALHLLFVVETVIGHLDPVDRFEDETAPAGNGALTAPSVAEAAGPVAEDLPASQQDVEADDHTGSGTDSTPFAEAIDAVAHIEDVIEEPEEIADQPPEETVAEAAAHAADPDAANPVDEVSGEEPVQTATVAAGEPATGVADEAATGVADEAATGVADEAAPDVVGEPEQSLSAEAGASPEESMQPGATAEELPLFQASSASDDAAEHGDAADEAEQVTAAEADATPVADEQAPHDEAMPSPEVPLEAEAPSAPTAGALEPAPVTVDEPDGFSFKRSGRATRFVWKIDAEGRFSEISHEFAEAVGPHATAVAGVAFADIAALFNLDPDGKIGELLARRDTWSGRTIHWPVEGTSLMVPVDLAALPTYTRTREFDGFRGFGVVRLSDVVEDPMQTGLTLGPAGVTSPASPDDTSPAAETARDETAVSGDGSGQVPSVETEAPVHEVEPVAPDQGGEDANPVDRPLPEEPADTVEPEIASTPEPALPPVAEPPALTIVETPMRRASDKVIQLHEHRANNAGRDGLSASEQAAFREIAKQLEPFGKREVPPEVTPVEETASLAEEQGPDAAMAAPGTDAQAETAAATQQAGNGGPAANDDNSRLVDASGESGEDFSLLDVLHTAIPPRVKAVTGLSAEIVDMLPVAILVHAGDRLIHGNPEFLRLTGYEGIEEIAKVGGLDALLQRHDLEGKTEQPGAMMVVRADDALVPVTARLQSIRWEDGSALLLAFMPVDKNDSAAQAKPEADEREDAPPARMLEKVAKLQVEAEELRSILETATDGVVVIGADGDIRSMNRSASALFNYDEQETRGHPFVMLFAHESQKAVLDYLSGLSGQGVASVLNDGREVIGREASGGFVPLFMTMGRLTSSNGFCAVIRDITQWKRTEEELRNAKRAAETANAHKSDFLARVSHEIRTPLNAIIGFSDMMAGERFGPIGHPRYVEYANDIGRSGRHVLDIVNDLLDISKIEAGEMELDFAAVGLNDAVAEAVSLVQPQANAQRVIIRTALAQTVPDIVADLRSIKQIALNVLSNAIRFTPSGGQIVVSTSYEANGSVVMRIRDTGVGMTRSELEQAMKPFRQVSASTARPRGDGTGLGLPLTKAMVDANRANFSIHSAPNEGTLVEITFPSPRVLAN